MSYSNKPTHPTVWDSTKQFALAIVGKAGEDNLPRLASSFSFFALLSFAPFLVFAVTIAAFFLGRQEVSTHVLDQAKEVGGPQVRDYLQAIIESSRKPTSSLIATALSLVVTFFSASNLFLQLDDAVNWIWRNKSPHSYVKNLIVTRIVAFFSVLLFGALLLGWLVLDTALGLLRTLQWVSFLATIVFFTFGFSLTFMALPRKQLHWRDTFPGAFVTALGFAISKFLLAYYFDRLSGVYTAAGGVVVLLLWMYYSSMIYFVGVEVTYVYCHLYGSRRAIAEEPPNLTEKSSALRTS
jgi:membrane protein